MYMAHIKASHSMVKAGSFLAASMLLNLESVSFLLYQWNNFEPCSLQKHLILKSIVKFLPQYGQVGNIMSIPLEQKIDTLSLGEEDVPAVNAINYLC